jgi:hypothetical protein
MAIKEEIKDSFTDLEYIMKSFHKVNNIELQNLLFNLKEKIERERFTALCNKIKIKNQFINIIYSTDKNLSLTDRLKKISVLVEKYL